MIDDVILELQAAIEKAHEALKRDLSKLRTGRAHPGMLDSIRVDYYGTPTPISQMAAVNVPEPRMITVKPWEKQLVQAIDKALRESNLGLNPQVDGDVLRIPVPPLSEERRRQRGHRHDQDKGARLDLRDSVHCCILRLGIKCDTN